MEYIMYVVFGFWYLCSLQALAAGIQYLVRRDVPRLRPPWQCFVSFAFGIAVTSILLWLYWSGSLGPWPTIITGTLLMGADAIFSLWSQGVFRKKMLE